MARDVATIISTSLNIIKVLHENDPNGEGIPTTMLAEMLGKHISVFNRYRNALEKLGLIEVQAKANRNLVRLTEWGRCVAKCLMS